jgi:hypothetical protein
MTRKTRSLLGTIGIIVLLVVYPLLIAAIFGDFLAHMPGWASILAFAVLGMLWFIPAAVVIRWISRQD